jgi:hypothetical protein
MRRRLFSLEVKRILDLAFRLQKLLWKWPRPRTRGVKVMLFNPAGRALAPACN